MAALFDDRGAGRFCGNDTGQKLINVFEMLAAWVIDEIEPLEHPVV